MSDQTAPTAAESRALILVGHHPSGGMMLPLGTLLDTSSPHRLADAIAGWTKAGWTDVHPAIEYLTYRRLTIPEAHRYIAQHQPAQPTTQEQTT